MRAGHISWVSNLDGLRGDGTKRNNGMIEVSYLLLSSHYLQTFVLSGHRTLLNNAMKAESRALKLSNK